MRDHRINPWGVALAAALLLAGVASASSIAVPAGFGGGTCGAGNANRYEFGGNCGSLVTIDNTTPAYVQDNSPAAEGTYRVRFYANFDGRSVVAPPATRPIVDLGMASGDAFDFFVAYDGADPAPPNPGGNAIIRAQLTQSGADRVITVYARLNAGTESSVQTTLTNKKLRGWRSIEINWAKATTAGGSDGVLQVWVDGVSIGNLTNLANGNQIVNLARWGAVNGIDAGTTGTFKLDDFVSQRTGYVGPAQPFSDNTNTANAFWPFIQSIFASEIMPGCTQSTFCPTTNILRGEMAKYIATSYLGTNETLTCTSQIFADVPCSHPYAPYINALALAGVVGGCGGGNYCPDGTVTRDQMTVFILAPLSPTPPTGCNSTFGDVPPANAFCPWVELAATVGLTGGCSGGNFCPSIPTARQEMSTFLVQAYQLPLQSVGP